MIIFDLPQVPPRLFCYEKIPEKLYLFPNFTVGISYRFSGDKSLLPMLLVMPYKAFEWRETDYGTCPCGENAESPFVNVCKNCSKATNRNQFDYDNVKIAPMGCLQIGSTRFKLPIGENHVIHSVRKNGDGLTVAALATEVTTTKYFENPKLRLCVMDLD